VNVDYIARGMGDRSDTCDPLTATSSGNKSLVREESHVNKDRVEGKAKEATGWAKDKAGEMTDNEDLEARGEAERAEGKAQGAVGKVKDAARDATDAVKDKLGKS
jgi:uncharacterized protein YjbJ (UPF0337 family)